MAAYAALMSLMNTVEQIQNHPLHSFSLDNGQINSLCEKVVFLQGFIEENCSHAAEVLESQIALAAHAAEDVIESNKVDRILAGSTDDQEDRSFVNLLDLQKEIKNMDRIRKKVKKFKEDRGSKDQKTTFSMRFLCGLQSVKGATSSIEEVGFEDHQPPYKMTGTTSSRPLTARKNTMVGFDDELIQLLDLLTGQQSGRQVISIVGMGGVGKTTLATNVYENPLIVQYFDIRSWGKISPNFNVREILLELLSSDADSVIRLADDELGEKLYKRLSGRRYLIVLDDLWSVEDWDKIKLFFPDNANRSRILITTRLSNVATYFGSFSLSMNFLDEDKSWKLFCEKAFAQEGCHPELEQIGKEIAKKCKGLPMSIVVTGGLLGRSNRTQEYWKNVAKDINPLLNLGEDEHCLKILSLSYGRLPAHLKPCFLFMGIYPENYDIRVSQLIKLWVAEGFLKPNRAQCLEEVAKGYLKDLIDRNLILVRRWGLSGKIRTCYIHDLLRNLCVRIAEKEKFLCVLSVLEIPQRIERERRVVLDEPIPLEKYHPQAFHALQSASTARSLICRGGWLSFKSRLLRVLTVVDYGSLEGVFQQVNLRYLAYKHYRTLSSEIPVSISLLWNLQTLIIRGLSQRPFVAPSAIWEMPQLRHLYMDSIRLPDPPSLTDQQVGFIMGNLQTISKAVCLKLNEDLCRRIPNLKKFHIDYCPDKSRLIQIGKSLVPDCVHRESSLIDRAVLLQNLNFPSSLQKLALEGCRLQWEDLTMIGSLPHLEVLKLGWHSVTGPEWP